MKRRIFVVTHLDMEVITYGDSWKSYKNFVSFTTRKSLYNYIRFLRYYKIEYGFWSKIIK